MRQPADEVWAPVSMVDAANEVREKFPRLVSIAKAVADHDGGSQRRAPLRGCRFRFSSRVCAWRAEADVRGERFEQLDAVRAFAVLAVVASHTLYLRGWAENGAYGVQLFFVISGFLITGILLDARRATAEADQPMSVVLRAFYARRALRIVPIYYLTLGLTALIEIPGTRGTLGWNLGYLSNWQTAFSGHWGVAAHLWSLSVEEQFYLLWPLVVLFVPRRILPWVIGGMLAVAVTSRAVLTLATGMWSDGIGILTPAALDSLGLGALLALLWRSPVRVDRVVAWLGTSGVALFVVNRFVGMPEPRSVIESATSIWAPLVFVWVVHHVARGVRGPLGSILRLRPLAYVGVVSYGVYLFHLFVVPTADIFERRTGYSLPVPASHGFAQFLAVTALSIAAAGLSWKLFEGPINRRKTRFPYVRDRSLQRPLSPGPTSGESE